jgi:site-specific DNA recombinase
MQRGLVADSCPEPSLRVTPTQPQHICGIYTRQSRDRKDEFSSCEAQFQACLEFVNSRKDDGWAWNDRRYDDAGEESETLDRPGLQRLLDDIRAGKVDRVVVHRLDRLSRRVLDSTALLQKLRDRGIQLTVVTWPELGITAEHSLVINILVSFAQFEREMTRERLNWHPLSRMHLPSGSTGQRGTPITWTR